MNDLNLEYNKIKDKIAYNREFLKWNKKYTKKMNKVLLIAIGLSGIMVLPLALYSFNILPTLFAPTLFFEIGAYGLIAGGFSVGLAAVLNTTMLINKIYLKKNRKKLDEKLKKINQKINFSKQNQQNLQQKQNSNNDINQKNNYSYKYQNSNTSSYSYPINNINNKPYTKEKKKY